MKKIQIKESNLIKLIEMEVQQYQDDEGISQKHFLTPIEHINIYSNSLGDLYVDDDQVVHVDWSLYIKYDQHGYNLIVKINKFLDSKIKYHYYDNGIEKQGEYLFNAKSFKFEQPKYFESEFKISNLDIDVDKKFLDWS